MRTLSHLTAAALLALGTPPAFGQSAPVKEEQQKRVEAERKAADERLRYAREMQQAHERLKVELEAKARQLEALRDQLAEEVKRKAEAAKSQPPIAVRRVEGVPMQVSDPAVALRQMTKSGDAKVAALAAQLIEQLEKKAAPTTSRPMTARLTLTSESSKAVEPLKVLVVSDGKTVKTPESSSTLRMSADGKTAAVVAADGTVTVYDTASGKEMMKFPVKK